jgi:hypothetical protein
MNMTGHAIRLVRSFSSSCWMVASCCHRNCIDDNSIVAMWLSSMFHVYSREVI